MVDVPTTIFVKPGSDLDRALTEARDNPVELVRHGVRYRLTRVDTSVEHEAVAIADEDDIWASYDPQRVQQRLTTSSRALRGVDRTQLLHDLADQRGQSSSGRPE